MYNHTNRVSRFSSIEMSGVVLPHTNKVLSESEIDRKIQKAQNHIAHLNNGLSQRKTHGGKGFRAKRISLQDQISEATARLNLLQTAKIAIPNRETILCIKEIRENLLEKFRETQREAMLKTARKVSSIALSILGIALSRTPPSEQDDIYSDGDICE